MRTITSKPNINKPSQSGMASILVTMILMVVMSLIVLGFAQVSRNNQRSALDSQLSKQAYYAAESGINDYAKKIRTYLTSNPNNPDISALNKTNCDTTNLPPAYKGVGSSSLNGTSDVQYTCVLVTANPTSLNYGSINSSSHVIPINSATTINSLKLDWQSSSNSVSNCPSPASIGQFPAAANWNCSFGILRIDLVPTTGSVSLSSLQATNMTAFLVPTANGSGLVKYNPGAANQYGSPANQGAIVAAKCSDTSGCTTTITDLGGTNYYLRVSSIYRDSSIKVAGFNLNNPNTNLQLLGAQVLIDATGKAQDILRRVQVRIPINATAASNSFDNAITTSQSLCKQFDIAPPNYFTNNTGC